MTNFNFTVNGNINNQQVITNPQGTVIQNNSSSTKELLSIFQEIKELLDASPARDSYSQQLQDIVIKTESQLVEPDTKNTPQAITSFTENVKSWLSVGQNIHDMAISTQTLFNSVSALF